MTDVFDIYSRGARQLVLRRGAVKRTRTSNITEAGLLYTGVTADAGPYTEGGILALVANEGNNPSISTNLSPVGQYIVHAWPTSFGPLTPFNFRLGTLGFPGDMQEVQTGLTVNGLSYTVARSDHLLWTTVPGAGGSQPLVVVA